MSNAQSRSLLAQVLSTARGLATRAVVVAVLSLGAGSALAAGANAPAAQAGVPTQNGKMANQMGKTKNAQRWDAAKRASDRRAARLRATHGKGK